MSIDVAKRLEMTHLTPDDLKKEVEAAAEAGNASMSEAERLAADPRAAEEYSFPFRHVAPNGRCHEGRFTSRILDVGEQRLMGILRAKLSNNTPYEALSPYDRDLNLMLAQLSFSLKTEGRPSWAQNLDKVKDVEVIRALYAEVAMHDAIFHGRSSVETGSEEES